MERFGRVSCATRRGEKLTTETRLGRAPSPGGEGRGEGEPIFPDHLQSRWKMRPLATGHWLL